nr:metalloregulator ArsR/SmtB family transcription factor [Corynebacterium lactis]
MEALSACCALGGRPLSDEEAATAAELFKALAQPARLQILSQIAQAGCVPATVNDLAKMSGLSQPTVSHHLKKMSDVGLLVRKKIGREVLHEVSPETFAELRRILDVGNGSRQLPIAESSQMGKCC